MTPEDQEMHRQLTTNRLPGIWPLVVCFHIYIIYLLSYLYYRRTNIYNIYIYTYTYIYIIIEIIIDCPSTSNLQKEREFCYIWFLGAKTSVMSCKRNPKQEDFCPRKVMRNHIETSDSHRNFGFPASFFRSQKKRNR